MPGCYHKPILPLIIASTDAFIVILSRVLSMSTCRVQLVFPHFFNYLYWTLIGLPLDLSKSTSTPYLSGKKLNINLGHFEEKRSIKKNTIATIEILRAWFRHPAWSFLLNVGQSTCWLYWQTRRIRMAWIFWHKMHDKRALLTSTVTMLEDMEENKLVLDFPKFLINK